MFAKYKQNNKKRFDGIVLEVINKKTNKELVASSWKSMD